MNSELKKRIAQAQAAADDAFWEAVTKAFPEATAGDLSPEATFSFGEASSAAITEWVENNVPGSKQ